MLAERLRHTREVGQVSARELGRLAGLPSESHVGTLEASPNPNPNAHTLTAICGVLGISVDYLLRGGPEPRKGHVRAAVAAARARLQAATPAAREPEEEPSEGAA